MSKKKMRIIVGYVNIGKSYLARSKPETYLEINPIDFKWEYDEYFFQLHEEKSTATISIEKKRRTNSPKNYVDTLVNEINKDRNVLISCQDLNEDDMHIIKREIPDVDLLLVYPQIRLKGIYLDNLRKRGIPNEFIQEIDSSWDKDILSCLKNKTVDSHIILREREYLWDGLNRFYKQNRINDRV